MSTIRYSIKAESLSKKFNRHFLFRDFSFEFTSGKSYALTGPNGSGKSTLLQILAGIQLPTAGVIQHSLQNELIEDKIYQHLSLEAPYSEVIEEFTLQELLDFHTPLKPFNPHYKLNDILEASGLLPHRNKEIRVFSSGMKQRVKLILTLFSETTLLFLDEPTTNMDESGIEWYRTAVQQVKMNRLVIIASNQRNEYDFCDEVIDLNKF